MEHENILLSQIPVHWTPLNDLEDVGDVEMTSARLSGILAYPNDLQIYLGQAVRISGILLYTKKNSQSLSSRSAAETELYNINIL